MRALLAFGVLVSVSAELFVIGAGYSYAVIIGVFGAARPPSTG